MVAFLMFKDCFSEKEMQQKVKDLLFKKYVFKAKYSSLDSFKFTPSKITFSKMLA